MEGTSIINQKKVQKSAEDNDENYEAGAFELETLLPYQVRVGTCIRLGLAQTQLAISNAFYQDTIPYGKALDKLTNVCFQSMVPDNKVGNALECPVRLLKRKEPEKDDSDTERMTKPHDSMNQFRCPVLRPTPHSSVQSGPVLRPKPLCSGPVFGKRRLVNIQIQGSHLSANTTNTSPTCDPEPIPGSAILS